jgi:hypothetical protein
MIRPLQGQSPSCSTETQTSRLQSFPLVCASRPLPAGAAVATTALLVISTPGSGSMGVSGNPTRSTIDRMPPARMVYSSTQPAITCRLRHGARRLVIIRHPPRPRLHMVRHDAPFIARRPARVQTPPSRR